MFQVMYLGSNLLPEGLETGEFKVGGTAEFDDLETMCVVAYSGNTMPRQLENETIGIINLKQSGYTVNGIAQSICFIITDNSNYPYLMNALQQKNYSDYIVSCFTIPKFAVQDYLTEENRIEALTGNIYLMQGGTNFTQSPIFKELASTPENLDGYTPRNQKLRTYPYMYLGFNPSNGSSKIYRYEDFTNGIPRFKLISEVNPNPSIYFIPQNYRGQNGDSMQDISSLNGYPTLSSKNDYYNSWIAQNSGIISLQMQQEQFNTELNAYQTGANMVGSMMNAINDPASSIGIIEGAVNLGASVRNYDYYIKGQMAQIEKQAMLPDKVNMSSSNATLIGYNLIDKNIFTRYTIKRQFAERIDKYFDMFGYLTNTVKIPNLNNRPIWNYIKTINANILGDIPQDDLQTIISFFDNGITLWHDTNNFLDYSQNNR